MKKKQDTRTAKNTKRLIAYINLNKGKAEKRNTLNLKTK